MATGLTKSQIIEIQTAAEFNYHKHRREAEDFNKLNDLVTERIAEAEAERKAKAKAKTVTKIESGSDKKGK